MLAGKGLLEQFDSIRVEHPFYAPTVTTTFARTLLVNMVSNSNNTVRTKPSITFPVFAALFIMLLISPEIGEVMRSEATATDVSALATGVVTLLFVGGLYTVAWAFSEQILSRNQRDIGMLSVCGVVIAGCLLVLDYVPDTPEAIVVLILTVLGVTAVLYERVS